MLLRVRRAGALRGRAGEESAAREGFRLIRGDRVLVVAFAVIGAVILFAAMDNVAEIFFARDTLRAGAWGYGLLASAWLVGMVGGATLIARRLADDRLLRSMARGGGDQRRGRVRGRGDRFVPSRRGAVRRRRSRERGRDGGDAQPHRAPRGRPVPRSRVRVVRRARERHAARRRRRPRAPWSPVSAVGWHCWSEAPARRSSAPPGSSRRHRSTAGRPGRRCLPSAGSGFPKPDRNLPGSRRLPESEPMERTNDW